MQDCEASNCRCRTGGGSCGLKTNPRVSGEIRLEATWTSIAIFKNVIRDRTSTIGRRRRPRDRDRRPGDRGAQASRRARELGGRLRGAEERCDKANRGNGEEN